MFKKISASHCMKVYNNFHLEKEENYDITADGFQAFGDYVLELTNSIDVTDEGNLKGSCFVRLCKGDMTNFAVGFFLKTENPIYFREKRLKKSGREKLLQSESVIIKGENLQAEFYPIQKKGYATYIEYDSKNNSVGFISVKEGYSSLGMENTARYEVRFFEK